MVEKGKKAHQHAKKPRFDIHGAPGRKWGKSQERILSSTGC